MRRSVKEEAYKLRHSKLMIAYDVLLRAVIDPDLLLSS